MTTPVYTSHDIVADAVLEALTALAPAGNAYWDVAPAGTMNRLGQVGETSPTADPLARVYVAQHQDGAGVRDARVRSAGWRGLVVVRCMSRSQATARAGYALVVAAMDALTAPTGYGVSARFDRQVPVAPRDKVYTAAGQWEISVRRAA